MTVVTRHTRPSVAGKHFTRTSGAPRLFKRNRLGLDLVFLIILALACLMICRDYLYAGEAAKPIAAEPIPIDYAKGDIATARAMAGLDDGVNDTESLEQIKAAKQDIDHPPQFPKTSFEKGNPTGSYPDGDFLRPVPLPPPGAPVLLPRTPEVIAAEKEEMRKREESKRLREETRRKWQEWRERHGKVKVGKDTPIVVRDTEDEDTGAGASGEDESADTEDEEDEVEVAQKPNIPNGELWDAPVQPVSDPDVWIYTGDLQRLFDIKPTNGSVESKEVNFLLRHHDIRMDPDFVSLLQEDSLELMFRHYAPISRRGWGGVLGGSPGSIPVDFIYHVRHTGDDHKGYGLYASVDLPERTVLGTYGGEVVASTDLEDGQYAWEMPPMVVLDPVTGSKRNESFTLDGRRMGNLMRFANDLGQGQHNLEPLWVPVDNKWILFYQTTRPVRAEEELSISYGDQYWDPDYGYQGEDESAANPDGEREESGGDSDSVSELETNRGPQEDVQELKDENKEEDDDEEDDTVAEQDELENKTGIVDPQDEEMEGDDAGTGTSQEETIHVQSANSESESQGFTDAAEKIEQVNNHSVDSWQRENSAEDGDVHEKHERIQDLQGNSMGDANEHGNTANSESAFRENVVNNLSDTQEAEMHQSVQRLSDTASIHAADSNSLANPERFETEHLELINHKQEEQPRGRGPEKIALRKTYLKSVPAGAVVVRDSDSAMLRTS